MSRNHNLRKYLRLPLLVLFCFLISFYFLSDLRLVGQYAPAITAIQDPLEVKVMTYNIRGGRTDQGQIDLAAIVEEVAALDPDIIALQEVDVFLPRSGYKNQVKFLAAELQMNYLFVPSLTVLLGGYGNAILSKYPIEQSTFIPLPSLKEQRGVLKADIGLVDGKIHVYATHLGLDHDEREQQMMALTEAFAQDNYPLILLGDFNATPQDSTIAQLRHVFHDPVHTDQLEVSTFKSNAMKTQIDYIFLSQGFHFIEHVNSQSATSDHNPLLYSIQFTPWILATPY
jgi:endonuclease/exonuclease/phosphatase family metal-dependent hydrolase